MDVPKANPLANIDMDYLHRLQDAEKESWYSHWNALLTFNGILLAAFSLIGVVGKGNKLVLLSLLACSILSSFLIIWNFISLGNLYGEIKEYYLKRPSKSTQDDKNQRRQKMVSQSKWRKGRTRIAQVLIVAECIMLFVFILTLP
ncbi:MAG: hypothetical protein ACKVRP_15140 [Bacteroidota bacterium]